MLALIRRLVLSCTAAVCLAMLGRAGRNMLQRYHQHDVGVAVTSQDSEENMPFPAFTICSSYFDFGKLRSDYTFRPTFFFGGSSKLTNNAANAYQFLSDRFVVDINTTTFLWKYYLTLDKIFLDPRKYRTRVGCRVGGARCEPPTELPAWPVQDDGLVMHVEVEAGVWTSQFLADGENGFNLLCHTLQPNVSVDFSVDRGAELEIRWNTENIVKRVPKWQLYVHDKYEQVRKYKAIKQTLNGFSP